MKVVRILAVDDHKMTMIGYKFILEDAIFDGYKVQLNIETTFVAGKAVIEESIEKNTPFDILMLDIQLSTGDDGFPYSGEDLGIIAREISPSSKIVFLSSFSDNFRINSILMSVNPDGYMVKSEINESVLKEMVQVILNDTPYYTKKALIAIRTKMSNDIYLDQTDKKILYYISIGYKTKDMVEHVSLSVSGIENRKRILKEIFGVANENDYALIHTAKEKGFI